MSLSLPTLAGIVATTIFASSALPMLAKAWRTRDLSSYSLGNLVLASVGNGAYSVYVFSLPAGPLWALHGFNLAVTGLMLGWFLRYETFARPRPGLALVADEDPADRAVIGVTGEEPERSLVALSAG